jgi:hypothetical protein
MSFSYWSTSRITGFVRIDFGSCYAIDRVPFPEFHSVRHVEQPMEDSPVLLERAIRERSGSVQPIHSAPREESGYVARLNPIDRRIAFAVDEVQLQRVSARPVSAA